MPDSVADQAAHLRLELLDQSRFSDARGASNHHGSHLELRLRPSRRTDALSCAGPLNNQSDLSFKIRKSRVGQGSRIGSRLELRRGKFQAGFQESSLAGARPCQSQAVFLESSLPRDRDPEVLHTPALVRHAAQESRSQQRRLEGLDPAHKPRATTRRLCRT